MSTPRSGEYWYYVNQFNEVNIGRVSYYDPDHDLSRVHVPCFGDMYVRNSHFVQKWEPNWFWKMLGYK